MDNGIETFWQRYLEMLLSTSEVPHKPYGASAFGDNAELANELAALIVNGTKTATCSALWDYQAEGDVLPQVGERYLARWSGKSCLYY
jgi:uncharacterized protein YhfF